GVVAAAQKGDRPSQAGDQDRPRAGPVRPSDRGRCRDGAHPASLAGPGPRRPGCPQGLRTASAADPSPGGTDRGRQAVEAPGSGLAEDAVEVGAALRALGLGHPGALVVDMYLAGRLTLGLALHAVELTAVGLCSHRSSPCSKILRRPGRVSAGPRCGLQRSVAGYSTRAQPRWCAGARRVAAPRVRPDKTKPPVFGVRLPSPASAPTIWRLRGVNARASAGWASTRSSAMS